MMKTTIGELKRLVSEAVQGHPRWLDNQIKRFAVGTQWQAKATIGHIRIVAEPTESASSEGQLWSVSLLAGAVITITGPAIVVPTDNPNDTRDLVWYPVKTEDDIDGYLEAVDLRPDQWSKVGPEGPKPKVHRREHMRSWK